MQRTVLVSLLALALAACTTAPTPFAAADGARGVGYSELRIEQNRYRVTWRGTDHPNAPGEDMALLRAADLALANGYDWFRVVSRNDRAESRGPTLSLGTGGADYGRHSAVGVGLGTSFDLGGPPLRTVTLEVLMEKGAPPHEVGAYDAHDAAKTIRGRI